MGSNHPLERNTSEAEYFGRLNRNGKAAYRHATRTLTGSLPTWAEDKRSNVATKQIDNVATTPNDDVTTMQADNVTTLPEQPPTLTEMLARLTRQKQTDEPRTLAVDPLTLL